MSNYGCNLTKLEEFNPRTAAAVGQEGLTQPKRAECLLRKLQVTASVISSAAKHRKRSWRKITKRTDLSCCDVQIHFWRCARQTAALIQHRMKFKSSVEAPNMNSYKMCRPGETGPHWILLTSSIFQTMTHYPVYEVRNGVKHHVYLVSSESSSSLAAAHNDTGTVGRRLAARGASFLWIIQQREECGDYSVDTVKQ